MAANFHLRPNELSFFGVSLRVRHFVPISRFPKNIQSTLLIHFPCKFHIIEIENKWKSRPTSESGWWLGTFFIVPSIWIDQSN